MSLKFASGEWTASDSVTVTQTRPFTMSAWMYTTDKNNTGGIMVLNDRSQAGAGADYSGLLHLNDASSNAARFQSDGTGASPAANAQSIAGVANNTWHHLCGCEQISGIQAARWLYLDGTKSTNTTAINDFTSSSLDQISHGSFVYNNRASTTWNFVGSIAEAAMWNVELSDAEVQALNSGYSPLLIRPQSLLYYNPLVIAGQEVDLIGGGTFTRSGTSKGTVHPRIIYPIAQTITGLTATPAPVGGDPAMINIMNSPFGPRLMGPSGIRNF